MRESNDEYIKKYPLLKIMNGGFIMDTGSTVIITMAITTVASGITQGILNSFGKSTESSYINFVTLSLLAVTAITIFGKAIKAIASLG